MQRLCAGGKNERTGTKPVISLDPVRAKGKPCSERKPHGGFFGGEYVENSPQLWSIIIHTALLSMRR